MKKLPQMRIVPASPGERRSLVTWLGEWKIDSLLRQGVDSGHRAPGGARPAASNYAEVHALAPGQIRLLHPSSDSSGLGPRYVVILERSGADQWTAAPYGRFSGPGIPGELRTRRRAPPLRVLCLWNARAMPGPLLRRSWLVDELAQPEFSETLEVRRLMEEDASIPAKFAGRVGPRLEHPLDPRVEYVESERQWFAEIAAHAGRHPQSDVAEGYVLDVRRVADKKSRYGVKRRRKRSTDSGTADKR